MSLFRNFYRCADCGDECTDEWSAQCDDDCPHCGARHISPYKSEDVVGDAPQIAALNDGLRRTFTGGKIVMTAGVAALPADVLAKVLDRVRTFDAFTPDN